MSLIVLKNIKKEYKIISNKIFNSKKTKINLLNKIIK